MMSGIAVNVANTLLRKHVALREGEETLIIVDNDTPMDLPNAFYSIAQSIGAEPTLLTVPSSFLEIEKRLPKVALIALRACDVYIPMTATTGRATHDIEYAKVLGEKKVRVIITGGWHGGGLSEILKALREHDYKQVYATTKALCEWLADKKTVRLTSEQGTDLTMSIEDIFNWKIEGGMKRWDGGMATEAGEEMMFPDGEAWGAPREGTTEGVVVCNGSIALGICGSSKGPDTPVKLTIKEGRVVKVEGGAEAKQIHDLIETIPGVDNIAEIAWGTNRFSKVGETQGPRAQEWDKHCAGTLHFALGHNVYQAYPFGTVDSPIHFDFTLRNHTCVVDGETIVKDERLLKF